MLHGQHNFAVFGVCFLPRLCIVDDRSGMLLSISSMTIVFFLCQPDRCSLCIRERVLCLFPEAVIRVHPSRQWHDGHAWIFHAEVRSHRDEVCDAVRAFFFWKETLDVSGEPSVSMALLGILWT